MKQRGFALLTLLPYIIGGIAIASLAGWAWWQWSSYKEGLREEGRIEVRVLWDAERAELIAARDAMVMRWAEAIQKVEVQYVEVVRERATRFVGLRQRAKGASYSGTIRLGSDAVGVLADSASAANAASAGPAGSDQVAPAPVPDSTGSAPAETSAEEWVTFAVDAAEAYRDARDKWQACVTWAGEIRNAGTD